MSSSAEPVVDATETGNESHKVFDEGILVIFGMLMIYMLFEAYKHKKGLKFGHEASLVCIVGISISALYVSNGSGEFADIMKFNDDLFFYFVLPPIVFASGFNMYRKKFFANIGNITLFGVIGTFIAFSCFSGLTLLVLSNSNLSQYTMDPDTGLWVESKISFTTMEVLLMCSLLCSSDVIAAVSMLSPKKQPKLFSLVFGEGIVNDGVSIILFNTVSDFAKSSNDQEFGAKAVGLISLEFIMLGIVSLAIGVFFGLFQSYLMKKVRSLTREPVAECAIIFAVAYISYVVAELAGQSGILTLLTCGVTMAHYGWYNLSPQGQSSSSIVFQFLGFIAEGFVFSYLGLTFFSYRTLPFSPSLIAIEFGIIMFGRAMATMGLIGVLKLCKYEKNHPNPVTFKELLFIWYAGLIRGAIAFGLVLRIDRSFEARNLIVTTCLSLVLISTIIFGSTVGLLSACLFPADSPAEEEVEEIEEEVKEQAEDDSAYESSQQSSHRSGIYHPNKRPLADDISHSHMDGYARAAGTIGSNTEARKKRRHPKWSCLQRFDEQIMKPLFIRKYTPKKERLADELFNTYTEDATELEKAFMKGE